MIGEGKPVSLRRPGDRSLVGQPAARPRPSGDSVVNCKLGNIADKPHVEVIAETSATGGSMTAASGVPQSRSARRLQDSTGDEHEGPVCAGTSRDPFPSTTVYVIATFVDPEAEHWDPRTRGDGVRAGDLEGVLPVRRHARLRVSAVLPLREPRNRGLLCRSQGGRMKLRLGIRRWLMLGMSYLSEKTPPQSTWHAPIMLYGFKHSPAPKNIVRAA